MQDIHLEIRATHQYVDGWSELDRWEPVGTLRCTPARIIRRANERERADAGDYVRFARLPAGLSRKQRKRYAQAVRDTLSGTTCRHEHDCCGCVLRSTRVSLQGRLLRAVTSVGYNY